MLDKRIAGFPGGPVNRTDSFRFAPSATGNGFQWLAATRLEPKKKGGPRLSKGPPKSKRTRAQRYEPFGSQGLLMRDAIRFIV